MAGSEEASEGGPVADAELVRLAQGGSRAAVKALYERYLPPIWRYVRTQVPGDPNAAEDIVGETFLAALRGLKDVRLRQGPLYPWLAAVARRKIADHWRRCRRTRMEHLDLIPEKDCPVEVVEPAGRLEAAETRDLVAETMGKLRDEERLVLEWKYVDDLSLRDMARRMSRTVKGVQGLLYRAKRSFRAVFPREARIRPDVPSPREEG